MASSRDRSSFWARLRPRQNVDSGSLEDSRLRSIVPMDIWNLLDEFGGRPPAQGTSRFGGSFASEMHFLMDSDIDTTMRNWLRNRNREPEVDISAVLSKCREVVYKPKSMLWGKAKFEADQSECPVCLEKMVAKDKLFLLPCNHRFHIDCLTPWIERNHACCPCCRADILGGPKKAGKASTSNSSTSTINSRPRGTNLGSGLRSVSITSGQSYSNRSSSGRDAWEGLHEYIMAALAEVDVELNRFMR